MVDSAALTRSNKVNMIHEYNAYQELTGIDNRIIRYGNVNFLGYDSIDANVLHLVGSDIAMQLRDILEDWNGLS